MERQEKLPPGWVKLKSKSRPGMSYFFNEKTKQAVWKLSDLKSPEKRAKMKSPPKKSSINMENAGISSKSIKIGKKNLAESRMKNLKMALEKEISESNESAVKPKMNNKLKELPFPPLPKTNPKVLPKPKSPEKKHKMNYSMQPSEKKKKLLSPRKRVEEKAKSEPVVESMDVDMTSLSQERNNVPEDYVEPMEWEEIDIEEVVKEVNNIRSVKSISSSLFPNGDINDCNNDDKFYIVVDTNIFCSNPNFIDRIKGRMFKDIGKARVIIPYIVLCELDMLKTREGGISKAAQRGIKVINEYFGSKDIYVVGQSIAEDSRKLIPILSGDDRILNCAFQLKEITKKVLVLSDDINLRNKAFVNGFEAFSMDMLNYSDFNTIGTIKFD